MRKLIIPVLLVVFFVIGFFVWDKFPGEKNTSTSLSTQKTSSQEVSKNAEYVIVPYWTLNADVSSTPFDNLMYFGISANTKGINTEEEGYKGLEEFQSLSKNKETLLVVRMLNNDDNLDVLDNPNMQKEIITESIEVAQKYDFDGVVLDLEVQGIPFESFVASITEFNKAFAKDVKNQGLTFGTFIYGDAYFRARPFNIAQIGEVVDQVFIMSYDFSKARGNPGPNFPLEDYKQYGYSFKTMIKDFSKDVPVHKLVVVFGMFGYDWTIDDQGRGRGQAVAKSTFEFQKFLTQCVSSGTCETSNNSAGEVKITYKENSDNHEIWFENQNSVDKKIDYLKTQGINSIGYWAYNYF